MAATNPVTGLLNQIEEDENAPLFNLRRLPMDKVFEAAPEFSSLIGVWDGKRRGGEALPDWSRFDFVDFRGWHSDIVISCFPDAEPDPLFRISGENFNGLVNSNIAGARFSTYWPRLFGIQFRDHFQTIRDTGNIGLVEGRLAAQSRGFLTVQVIELPCRDGGDGVGRLIHGIRVS
ncbi:PAS domain-containing protein [Hwanghaeella grinnelliae]|uniref:PAS domain-containing protein n=1 Tax=Hwanghaeella grinnelliae TaxID=2500179 RepID=UPI0013873201|nr:PAS domain-containing protein [Hwanghaeella grinnelliae]